MMFEILITSTIKLHVIFQASQYKISFLLTKLLLSGMVEHVRDQIINWKLDSVGHNPTAEQYLG